MPVVDSISFLVQGSASEPYKVTFFNEDSVGLKAVCTCPAGQKGQYCKHRVALLQGNGESVVSGNIEDLKIVQRWLIGSRLEAALQAWEEAEMKADDARRKLSKAKKALAKAMYGAS